MIDPTVHATLEDRARTLARQWHANQNYGNVPYQYHLADVVSILVYAGFRSDELLLASAYLHDVLEDTKCPPSEIERVCGKGVLDLVQAVTNEQGKNRLERNEATYPKIVAGGQRTITLKLADRIANVEACWKERDSRLFMYHSEYPEFRKALGFVHVDSRIELMWTRLDELMGFTQTQR